MSKQSSNSSEGQGPAPDRSFDESWLTELLLQPYWYPEQAAQVLAAQAKSGQSIRQFEMLHGLSVGRLYYWKRRLKQEPVPASCARATEHEDPELGPSVHEAGLDLENPYERQAHQYVERATSGQEPTWRLYDLRRQGPLLLLVVRWVNRSLDPEPYSLVDVELTALWVRWRDYPTVDAAREALYRRCSGAVPKDVTEGVPPLLPPLVKVEVLGQTAVQRPEPPTQSAPATATGCITVCMRSGVRIEIPAGVQKELLSTVLWALRNQPC